MQYSMTAIQSTTLAFKTPGHNDVQDITPAVAEWVAATGVRSGFLSLFVHGSTAALTTIEFESGVVADLKAAIERMAPDDMPYDHDRRWGDGNGYAHVRAALLGPSLTIPITDGTLALGTWQQIVLVDFDNRPRHRQIVAQIVGEDLKRG
jgi:secondary thiamine-phosphate synthase enzyme